MNRLPITIALLTLLAAAPVAHPAPPAGAKVTKDGWFAPVKTAAKPAGNIARAFVIPIRRDIVSKTLRSLRKKLEYCIEHKAQLVVLDMDVRAGHAEATMDVSRMLKTDMRGLRIVCYVRTRALGAGVFIAMACDEIAMTPVGQFGVGGILPWSGVKDIDREKIESVPRSDLAESAQRAGRNVALAEKLVSANREIWLIRNKTTRELRYVRALDWRGRVVIPPGVAQGVSNDQAEWTLLRIVMPKGEIPTLLPRQAAEYGLVDHIVDATAKAPYDNLLKLYNVTAKPVVLDSDRLPKDPFAPASTTKPTTAPAATTGRAEFAGPRQRAHPRPGKDDLGGWFAEIKPTATFSKLPAKITKAYILPIRRSEDDIEDISDTTYKALRRKAIRCRAGGAQLIIIDMHTWGGGVIAALDIARLIKHDLADIYVVCYVRSRGVSAGALIASACDEIVMTPVGKIGDCAPIVMGGTLAGTEREKIETVLREEFAESAKRNGYSIALAESLVSIHREVWKVRHKRTDELKYVLKKDFRGQVFFAPGKIDGRSNPEAEWELLEVTVPEGELLTMDPAKAVQLGFVSKLIPAPRGDPYANILKEFNVVEPPTILRDTWSESLVGWLTHPIVSGLLMLFGMMFVYVEIRTPGLGLPAILALVCFGIMFGSHFLIGLAAWWEIALFIIGLILIALEVFVIPGFGVAGISGIACCIVGLLVMFIDNAPNEWPIPKGELGWDLFSTGVFVLCCAVVGAFAAACLLARYLPKVPVAGRIVLADVVPNDDLPVMEDAPIRRVRLGDCGVTKSVCRPVGKAMFGDVLVDVTTEGGFLDPGTPVRVVSQQGTSLLVEEVESE